MFSTSHDRRAGSSGGSSGDLSGNGSILSEKHGNFNGILSYWILVRLKGDFIPWKIPLNPGFQRWFQHQSSGFNGIFHGDLSEIFSSEYLGSSDTGACQMAILIGNMMINHWNLGFYICRQIHFVNIYGMNRYEQLGENIPENQEIDRNRLMQIWILIL
jgi:hypothetical protein